MKRPYTEKIVITEKYTSENVIYLKKCTLILNIQYDYSFESTRKYLKHSEVNIATEREQSPVKLINSKVNCTWSRSLFSVGNVWAHISIYFIIQPPRESNKLELNVKKKTDRKNKRQQFEKTKRNLKRGTFVFRNWRVIFPRQGDVSAKNQLKRREKRRAEK